MMAFWLLPAPPAREAFSLLIRELSGRFDAPIFEPHLTLHGSAFDDVFSFEELPQPASIELEIVGVEHSDKFTKTVFAQFRKTNEVAEVAAAVARALGDKDNAEFNPHVSLIYKTMPAAEKAELARNIRFPFERVRFDTIKAVSTPARIESREEVESWRTLWERPLR